MFLFSKTYKNSINKDYLKKIKLTNYQKIKSRKGENLNLAFLNLKIKKEQKNKLKHLLTLELLLLQIYNGNKYAWIVTKLHHIGHKFGDFVLTNKKIKFILKKCYFFIF